MPIYEYQCQECSEKFDILVRSTGDTQNLECPKCGSKEVQKAISLFGVGSSQGSSAQVCSTGPV